MLVQRMPHRGLFAQGKTTYFDSFASELQSLRSSLEAEMAHAKRMHEMECTALKQQHVAVLRVVEEEKDRIAHANKLYADSQVGSPTACST